MNGRSPAKSRGFGTAPTTTTRGDFRFGPGIYLIQTQPGFEGIASEEIAAHRDTGAAPRARELARRTIPGRAGMSIVFTPDPQSLQSLRVAEDIFALVGYRRDFAGDAKALEHIRAAAREAPFVADALEVRVRLLRGARAGRRLKFRVIARMAGEHEFRRIDLKRAVERGVTERGDHTWRLAEDGAEVEFWATLFADELLIAVRLSDERMRHRDYKIAHIPGSLRPSVAAALAWLSRPEPEDVVLDPSCGAGTVLIERAHLGRYKLLIGSDNDQETLRAATLNIGPRYKPIELHPWEAAALPLPDHSVNKVIANLPWGKRFGSHAENRRLYPRIIGEFMRVTRAGGKIVMLTAETRLMSEIIGRQLFRPEKILRVTILGAAAAIYTCSV